MGLELIIREPMDAPKPTPLLFVHGILHGAWCWDEYWLPYFAERGYIASAVSLRGHGRSTGECKWASIWDYVEDVAFAAEQIEQQFGVRPTIIGHSMGGWVTQLYLQKYRAPAAVLVASVPASGAASPLSKIISRFPATAAQSLFTQSFLPLSEAPSAVRWLFFGERLNEREIERHRSRLSDESMRLFLEAWVTRPEARKVPYVPMLVLNAEEDALISLEEGRQTAKAYGADYITLPHLAHDMMLDVDWQTAAQTVYTWLDKHAL